MRKLLLILFILSFPFGSEHAKFVQTPYQVPFKVVVEFYFDELEKIRPALLWISNIIYVLSKEPYNFIPQIKKMKRSREQIR